MDRKSASGLAARITALVVCVLALCIAATPAWAKALTAKQIANKVLKLDPRKPSDINLFTSKYANGGDGFYPQGSAMHPASGPAPTEAQVRAKLKSYLQAQFPNDAANVTSGLALFDGQQAKDMIPEPILRAALVGMRGTLLQPTIGHLLNSGKFESPVRFGSIPQQGLIAVTAGAGPRFIRFNNRYEREDFRYLVGIIGHEALHDDTSGPGSEEAVMNTLSAMTYLQVLSKHPELAYTGTELSRQMNDLALLFLNSRENDSPNSEIFAPTGVGVAPGSPRNEPDMWSIFNGDSTTSPAPATLGQVLRALGLPTPSKFSLATAKTFANLNDNWLSDVGRVQIEVLLQMLSVKTIADKANLSRSKVISKLHLKPYLAAIK